MWEGTGGGEGHNRLGRNDTMIQQREREKGGKVGGRERRRGGD